MYADEDIVLYSKPNEGSNEVIVIPAGSSIYVNSSIEKNDYREFRYGRYKGWTRSSKYVYGKKGWTKKLYGTASVSNSTIDSTYRRSYYTPSSTYTPSRGTVQVKGYYRKDGTYVRPHTRSAPRRR
jgi:hypothetical protein